MAVSNEIRPQLATIRDDLFTPILKLQSRGLTTDAIRAKVAEAGWSLIVADWAIFQVRHKGDDLILVFDEEQAEYSGSDDKRRSMRYLAFPILLLVVGATMLAGYLMVYSSVSLADAGWSGPQRKFLAVVVFIAAVGIARLIVWLRS